MHDTTQPATHAQISFSLNIFFFKFFFKQSNPYRIGTNESHHDHPIRGRHVVSEKSPPIKDLGLTDRVHLVEDLVEAKTKSTTPTESAQMKVTLHKTKITKEVEARVISLKKIKCYMSFKFNEKQKY